MKKLIVRLCRSFFAVLMFYQGHAQALELKLIHTFQTAMSGFGSASISEDGRHILVDQYGEKSLFLYDKTGKLVHRFNAPKEWLLFSDEFVPPTGLSNSGNFIGSMTSSNRLLVWNAITGKNILDKPQVFGGEGKYLTTFAFSPDSRFVVVAGTMNGLRPIKVFSLATGKVIHEGTGDEFTFHPDSNELVYNSDRGSFIFVNLQDENMVELRTHEIENFATTKLLISPGGEYIYTGNFHNISRIDSGLSFYKFPSHDISGSSVPYIPNFSTDGHYFLLSGLGAYTYVINLAEGRLLDAFIGPNEQGKNVNCAIMDGSSRLITVQHGVQYWNLEDQSILLDVSGPKGCVEARIVKQGTELVTVDTGWRVHVWKIVE